jgi:TRAP-type C4-dicarboxylate transport system substrate-binding protein
VRDFVAALGATPVGVPPTEMAEQLQKGTIDGVFIDYGGAGIAFKLGGIVKHTTQMYSYVTSFGLVMNPAFYAKLPPDLQKLVVDTTTGMEQEVGRIGTLLRTGEAGLIEGGDDHRGAEVAGREVPALAHRSLRQDRSWKLIHAASMSG